jgi:hypothetical protein
MRQVVQNPEQAKIKGQNARRTMVEKYSPTKVTDIVLQRLKEIVRILK